MSPPISILPNYFSPIHRPSTNPFFVIDARSKYEFAEGTDVSGERFKINIWGKIGSSWLCSENVAGTSKGKEKEWLEDGHGKPEWKMLEQWNVNLTDLVPLPDDVRFSYCILWKALTFRFSSPRILHVCHPIPFS